MHPIQSVLLISRCPPVPIHLGDRLIVWHLARELASRGVALDLIAFYQEDDDPHSIAQYQPFFRHITLLKEPARSPISLLARLFLPALRFPTSAQKAWSGALWQPVQHALATTHYDAIHLFGSVQVYDIWHALGNRHAIITPYESFTLFLSRVITQQGGILARLRYWVAWHYERFMFTPYAQTVVLSEQDANMLTRIQPRLNVRIIPNGIDLEHLAPLQLPRHPHTLLFVGNYEYAPNVDAVHALMSEVLPVVRRHYPQVRVWIVGNAPPPDVLAYASDTVTITGYVDDVRPYLAQATLFVCALRMGAGIKNKLLEALAMRLPIVATPLSVEGIHVTHGQSAWIAEVAHLGESVVRLFDNPAQQATLAENGRTLIEQAYTWSGVAESYLALYQEEHP